MTRLHSLNALFLLIAATLVHAQKPALFTPSQVLPVGQFGGHSGSAIGTPDGGFILCDNYEPETRPQQLGMRITKLMPDGRVLWSRMYEIDDGDADLNDINGIDGIRPVAIVRNADGNYAVACELVKLSNDHFGTLAVVVLIVDPMGYEITHHTYRKEFLTNPLEGKTVRKRADTSDHAPDDIDNGVFVDEGYDDLGVMSFVASPTSLILLVRSVGHPTIAWLTHDGALVSAQHLVHSPGNVSEYWDACDLRIDSSGRLLVIGWHEVSDRYRTTTTITLFDADGRLLRSRTLPLSIHLQEAESIILSDGALLLTGSAIEPDDRQDVPHDSRSGERSPSETESLAYIERQSVIRIDSGLSEGRITYIRRVKNEPVVDRITMLATGEIMILHSSITELFDDVRIEEWYTVHEADGTLLFGEVLGPIESHRTETSDEPLRAVGVSVSEMVAGPSGSVMIHGEEEEGTQFYAVVDPHLPLPCIASWSVPIDTLSRAITLSDFPLAEERFEPTRGQLNRRFAITQHDMELELIPLCDPLMTDDTVETVISDMGTRIDVDEQVVSVGESIEASVRVAGTTSIRVIRADDGKIVWERSLQGSDADKRVSIPTLGWEPGVHILSIDRGESLKVLVRP